MESKLKGKKIAPLDALINFFAFQYDLAYYCIKVLIGFFAYQYDLVANCIKFICEYVNWITDIRPIESPAYATLEESVQIHN